MQPKSLLLKIDERCILPTETKKEVIGLIPFKDKKAGEEAVSKKEKILFKLS